jgi:transcriptional regulator with XRE-family HTH domain
MEKWISGVVGKMHVHKVTQTELANKIGIRRDYLNKILGGIEKPSNARMRITAALDELIKQKEVK